MVHVNWVIAVHIFFRSKYHMIALGLMFLFPELRGVGCFDCPGKLC